MKKIIISVIAILISFVTMSFHRPIHEAKMTTVKIRSNTHDAWQKNEAINHNLPPTELIFVVAYIEVSAVNQQHQEECDNKLNILALDNLKDVLNDIEIRSLDK